MKLNAHTFNGGEYVKYTKVRLIIYVVSHNYDNDIMNLVITRIGFLSYFV